MPPRYVYWTILIDNKPTAFRARDKEELLPTFTQLSRTNKDVAIKYFAHGQVWDSPEHEREQRAPTSGTGAPGREKRGRDWRPGGTHEDPRARFDKQKQKQKNEHRDREARGKFQKPAGPKGEFGQRPPSQNKSGERRPWEHKSSRPPAAGGDRRPWEHKSSRPPGASGDRRPWQDKPRGPGAHRGPAGPGGPNSDRPWTPKPPSGDRGGAAGSRGARPWTPKPPGGGNRRPWQKDRPAPHRPAPHRPARGTTRPPRDKKPKPPEDD